MRRLSTAVAALAAVLVIIPTAQAGGGVTLNLKAGTGNRTLCACGIRHHYTVYPRGRSIAFDGTVPGAPPAFKVKLKVKRCTGGRFVNALQQRVAGSHGRYRAAFKVGAGSYFARTSYRAGSVLKSDKQYFKVG
jgi:hypothetical protein